MPSHRRPSCPDRTLPLRRPLGSALLLAAVTAGAALAQQPAGSQQPLAYVPTEGVSVSGSLNVANGRAAIGNDSSVTAGQRSAQITLARGGSLKVCASTSIHISRDAAPLAGPVTATPASLADNAGLMVAIDRGALEANYTAGRYSDVLLTPDLRILVSGPGTADLKLRVNQQGDTCVDNHGVNAPYVTVSSLMDGGVYRVQPDQRVLFEHGSLQQVVDREAELCGCPEPAPAHDSLAADKAAGKHVGGPSSTPADTEFPVAVSEGLAPAPTSPTTPVVALGQAHAQVTASLSNDTPPGPPPAEPPSAGPAPAVSTPAPATSPAPQAQTGILHKIGHFFSRIFGQ